MSEFVSDRQKAAQYARAESGNPLHGMSPDDAEQWVIDNVTDLASAKIALRHTARILALHNKYIEVLVKALYG